MISSGNFETDLSQGFVGQMGFDLLAPVVMAQCDLDSRATIEAKERGGSDQDEGAQDH